MNREVEERLVAMYFDNQDFEKHAKETINTLDKLKESMNLEDSAKGFDVFSKMKRNAGMEDLQRSANKLKETFGSVGTALNKAFDIGTGPLRKVESAIGSLSGYINKYLGFDFASKIVGSIESAIRGLTIQPISQGWHQYESEVDSVKTIMSSTGRSIDDVTKNLDDLRTYADKTIYSLQDMTSNLGKFTNNGVALEDATKAMMGVANAAALAGQGTQQASMAMYNISQAIGVGKMTTIDWKSIENANMATQDLKNAFIQVAAAQNNLKKVTKDGVTTYYYVKDSKGNEIKDQKKWVEINYKNFRENLSKGWLTSDTLTATLAALSGTPMSAAAWETQFGITDKETIKYLEEMGKKALEAASQVRTFSKMMTTLKDSVASGWSQTFKFIVGDAEEAVTLWTGLSDRISGVLNRMGNKRNEILYNWKNTREVIGTQMIDSGSGAGMVEQTIYGRNGREILIDGLKNLADVVGSIGSAFSKAFGSVFKGLTSGDLFSKTQEFEKLTIRIKEWLGDIDDSGSRLNKIYRIIRGVVSAFKMWKNAIRNAANAVIRFFVPSADGILDVLAWIGDFVYDLSNMDLAGIVRKIGEKLKEAWEKITSWFKPQAIFDQFGNQTGTEVPIVRWLNNILSSVGTGLQNIANEIGLGGFIEWISNIFDGLGEAWNTAVDGAKWVFEEIGKFFSPVISEVTSWISEKFGVAVDFFTKPNEDGETGFSEWITNVFSKVETAWNTAVDGAKTVLREIGKFLSNAWNWILERFGIGGSDDDSKNEVDLEKEIENRKSKLNKNLQTVADVFSGGVFSNEKYKMPETASEESEAPDFLSWLTNFWENVKKAWDNLVSAIDSELNNPDSFIYQIGQFLSNAWNWILDKAGVVITEVKGFFIPDQDDGTSKFTRFISGFWDKIEEAWNTMTESIANSGILTEIGKFLSDTWNWLLGILGVGSASAEETNTAFIGSGIVEGVRQFVKVTEEITTETNEALEAEPGSESVESKLQPILDFFTNLFETIGTIIQRVKEYYESNATQTSLNTFFTGLGTFLNGLFTAFGKLFEYIGDKLQGNDVDWTSIKPIFDTLETFILELLKLKLGDLALQLGSGLISKFLGGESLASSIRDIGIGVGLIFGAIAALKFTGVTKEDLDTYLPYIRGMVVTIGLVMMLVNGVTGAIANGAGGKESKFDGTKVLKKLIGSIEKAAIIYIVMDKLPDLIKAFADAKSKLGNTYLTEDIVMLIAGSLGAVMLGALAFVGVSAVAGKVSLTALGHGAAYVAAVIVIMAGLIAVISNTIQDTGWSSQMAEKAKHVRDTAREIVGIGSDMIVAIADIPGLVVKDTLKNAGEGLSDFGAGIGGLWQHIIGQLTPEEQAEMELARQRNETNKLNIAMNGLLDLSETLDPEKLEKVSNLIGEISKLDMGGYVKNMGFKNFADGFTQLVGFLTSLFTTVAETPDIADRMLDERQQKAMDQIFDATRGALSIFGDFTRNNQDLLTGSKNSFTNMLKNIGVLVEDVDGVTRFGVFLTQMDAISGNLQEIFTTEKYPNLNDSTNNEELIMIALDRVGAVSSVIESFYQFIRKSGWISDKYWELREIESDSDSSEGAYLTGWGYNLGVYIESIMRAMETMMAKIEEHPQLTNAKVQQKANRIRDILQMFDVFAAETGVGSASWKQNYNRFRELAEDESFVDGYIQTIQKIYKALEENEIGGEEVITFDGINIVSSLFDAIQEGLDNAASLPDLDATNLTAKIIESIGLGKTAMAAAVRDMIQNGVNEVNMEAEKKQTGTSNLIQSVITDPNLLNMLTNPQEYVNSIMSSVTGDVALTGFTDVLTSQLSGLTAEDGMLTKLFSGFEEKIQDAIPEVDFDQILADKGYQLVDEEGNPTGILGDITSAMETLNTELEQNPIRINLIPVIELDQLTTENLQQQLNGLGLTAPIDLPAVSIDFTALKTELGMDEIKQKLDAIKLAIDLHGGNNTTATSNLGIHMDGIRNEIGNMHMVLDSGILVAQMLPMIDQGLYNRALLEYRSGTSPRSVHYVP